MKITIIIGRKISITLKMENFHRDLAAFEVLPEDTGLGNMGTRLLMVLAG